MLVIRNVQIMEWWHSLNVSLKLSKADCEAMSEALLPLVIVACLVAALWEGLASFCTEKNPMSLVHALICFAAIGVTALPLCSLTRPLQRHDLFGLKPLVVPLYQYAQSYRLVNGYGLFRRMTGVGPLNRRDGGWAGQPPSIVQRPEIVIEGQFAGDDDDTWSELSCRWKPGDLFAIPRQVAPHQPRYVKQVMLVSFGLYGRSRAICRSDWIGKCGLPPFRRQNETHGSSIFSSSY